MVSDPKVTCFMSVLPVWSRHPFPRMPCSPMRTGLFSTIPPGWYCVVSIMQFAPIVTSSPTLRRSMPDRM